jgi:hypothetical protein
MVSSAQTFFRISHNTCYTANNWNKLEYSKGENYEQSEFVHHYLSIDFRGFIL